MRDCKLLWLQQRVGAEVKQGEWTPARRTSSLATQVTNTAPLRAQGQGEGERCLVCSPTPHPTLRVCVCVCVCTTPASRPQARFADCC